MNLSPINSVDTMSKQSSNNPSVPTSTTFTPTFTPTSTTFTPTSTTQPTSTTFTPTFTPTTQTTFNPTPNKQTPTPIFNKQTPTTPLFTPIFNKQTPTTPLFNKQTAKFKNPTPTHINTSIKSKDVIEINNNLDKLEDLKYLNSDTFIINENENDVYLEIISLLKRHTIDDVRNFLEKCKNKDDILWNLMGDFEKEKRKLQREIFISQYQPEGVKGVFRCPKCNNDIIYIKTKQTSSGDEGTTVFFRCGKCGHQWFRK